MLKAIGIGNRSRQYYAAETSWGITFKMTEAMGNSVSSFQGKGGENTSNSDLLRQNNKKRERKEKNKTKPRFYFNRSPIS